MVCGSSWNEIFKGDSSELQISQLLSLLFIQGLSELVIQRPFLTPCYKPTKKQICLGSVPCVFNDYQSIIKILVRSVISFDWDLKFRKVFILFSIVWCLSLKYHC